MKKFILAILCMVLSVNVVYAESTDHYKKNNEQEIEAKSIYVIDKQVSIEINEGIAQYGGSIVVADSDLISKCVLTIKLVNEKGISVKTKSTTIQSSKSVYTINDSCNLNIKGEYTAEFIAKLYRGSKPIETVRGSSIVCEYK